MAVTVTTVSQDADSFVFDVETTADADVSSGNVAHGLGPGAPFKVFLTALQQAEALLSGWAVTTIDGTNVVLTASAAVGSGVAGAQIRCTVIRRNG